MGKCIDCPHGGNFSTRVLPLPNYWGHMTAANRLEFHRCPIGYCCNQAPCEDISQCASHREGKLCGRCKEGFSESFLSQACIADAMCRDTWVLPLFVIWAVAVTLAIIFMGDMADLFRKCLTWCKELCSGDNTKDGKQVSCNDIDIEPLAPRITQPAVDKFTQKDPILWGLLTIHRQHDIVDSLSSHKYVQIALYYLQDAALMQVDLTVGSKGSIVEKVRNLLCNVSQLAVALLDLGLMLCPIRGWTPAYKLVAKNLTGPLVFCFILTIYCVVTFVSWCMPSRKQTIRKFWYCKLTAAAIFSLLFFFQQIANTTFSLLYCIQSSEEQILFIDGTVTCYQPWQILVFIFALNWVIAIIPALMFLPGLVELRLIIVREFFIACAFPGPMLFYWAYRFRRKKLSFHTAYGTIWQDEAIEILQKSFVKTTYNKVFPFCWIGFMKIRRLALVLIFTFVGNLVGRISLMSFVILLFLMIHNATKPYEDEMANKAYLASLMATLCIGFTNIMKATCVEFYLDLEKVKHSLETLEMITDTVFVFCPPFFLFVAIIAFVWRKLRAKIQQSRNTGEGQ